MTLSADLLRGYTDAIILRQLSKGDSYGYMISKTIADQSQGRLELKEATLYTAFRRMESGGLIQSYWGNEIIGARRRYYHLTDAGRERLLQEQQGWAETRETLNLLIGEGCVSPDQAENNENDIEVIPTL